MKTLYLLRHAKSGWDDPDLADHDRPLDGRGERAALVVGRYMAQEGFLPDLILCSTARRTMQTQWLVVSQWTSTPPTEFDRGLYLSGEDRLMARLRQVDNRFKAVLLIAHNPDLQNLARQLAQRGDPALLSALADKYPTAALSVIKLPIAAWSALAPAQGTLIALVTPKALV